MIPEAWIFAFFVMFAPNPYDNGEPFNVPPWFALEFFELAEQYNGEDGVEPEELVATIMGEHARRAPYPIDSIGKAGEVGLFQLTSAERREANEELGTSYSRDDILEDWRSNAAVAAYVIHDKKRTHRTKKRCTKKVSDGVRINSKGELVPVYRKQRHTWWTHYRCGVKARERCAAKGATAARQKLAKMIGKGWRELAATIN